MSLGILKSLRKGAEGNPLACLHSGVPWVLGGGIWTLHTREGLRGSSRVCRLQLQGRCTSRAAQLPTTQRFAAITIIPKSLPTRLNAFTHSPFTLYLLLMAAQLISRPRRVWHCGCREGRQALALRSSQPNCEWRQMEGKHHEPLCFSLWKLNSGNNLRPNRNNYTFSHVPQPRRQAYPSQSLTVCDSGRSQDR